MQTRANRIKQIIDRGGFLTAEDVERLNRGSAAWLRNLPVLIRCHEGRPVVPLHEVANRIEQIERDGWHLRDVSFTVKATATLRKRTPSLFT